jgi:hypothetical protein
MTNSLDDFKPVFLQSHINKPLDSEQPKATPLLGSATIQPANPEFGTPVQDTLLWDGQQSYPDTCAIRCQEFILEQFTGRDIAEDTLVREAMEHGWYAPGSGTSVEDVGNLLELNGIPIHRYQHATIFHLANELAQGHKVIVGVDSGELWRDHPILEAIEDKLGINGADHAVVVSGIDTSIPTQTNVIISDPGTGEAVASYPLDLFVDAWKDSNFFMVATENPAPKWLPEMVHFDYTQGHIDEVFGLPYQQFLNLADNPDSWDAPQNQSVQDNALKDMDNSDGFAALDIDFDAELSDQDHNMNQQPEGDDSTVPIDGYPPDEE